MYRGDPDDGNIFLPLNSTKHVLVATFFVKFWADMEVENLVRETVCSLKSSGLCEDALSFSFFTTEDCVHIYKKVPVLDVINHLNPN